jgi:stress up-regulated protein Nod 19
MSARWPLGLGTVSAAVVLTAALLPASAASDDPLLPNPTIKKSTIKRYVFRFGPVNLGSYQVRFKTDHPQAPGVDGSLIAMNARVVDRDGNAIPPQRVMLHHLLFLNEGRFEGDRHDGVCTDIPRERFYGKGEEGQVLRLPEGYGYPLRAGDKWRLNWMLMNHKLERQVAYIEYTVVVDTAAARTPVRPLWFDVVGCRNGSLYNVPGGGGRSSTHSKSMTWTAPENGRLVAGGAHLHGGATDMVVNEPDCDSRWLFDSKTLYGMPDHPYYQVRPVLHEPGPISSGWFTSETGIPIAKGERLGISSKYDDSRPHMAVMGIMHAYMALDGGAPAAKCQPLPDDIRYSGVDGRGRRAPPTIHVPLTKIDSSGQPRTIERVRGRLFRLGGDTTVDIKKFRFSKRNLSIPLGASILWRFRDRARHAVTLANGPLGFGSNFLRRGQRFKQRFTRPGVLQVYCQLHPVTMHEIVRVRRKKR